MRGHDQVSRAAFDQQGTQQRGVKTGSAMPSVIAYCYQLVGSMPIYFSQYPSVQTALGLPVLLTLLSCGSVGGVLDLDAGLASTVADAGASAALGIGRPFRKASSAPSTKTWGSEILECSTPCMHAAKEARRQKEQASGRCPTGELTSTSRIIVGVALRLYGAAR